MRQMNMDIKIMCVGGARRINKTPNGKNIKYTPPKKNR
jgi:hypothetical protein